MQLRAGDFVEVRSKEEILSTLDDKGRLEGLPFMPQMFQYCGKRFKVYKRAHKTCDTVNVTGGRRLAHGVHLDLRCDGEAYGGCQAACLIFWKEAWLKPITPADSADSSQFVKAAGAPRCSEDDVWRATHTESVRHPGKMRYICQATELPNFTTPLPWWDVTQYVEDYKSGNATLSRLFYGFAFLTYYHLTKAWRHRLGRPGRWVYDKFQALRGGIPFPRRPGDIPLGQLTPTCSLNLQPGETVRVRPYKEILATLDRSSKNRGMIFDAEMVPFCGGTYRVKTNVTKFIDEKTGEMTSLKTPAVILDGVWCNSCYSNRKMFCPRSIYSWWREIWLERVPQDVQHR
jgi:hypothetical protein